MKTTPIYMKRWLEANGRKRALPGDTWYLNFANEVLPLVAASPLFQDHAAGKAAQTALDTALYFQDAIAQAGGWKAFTARYRMLYGQPLPFYACNDYIDDEINRDDVCFLLWKNLSGLHPSFHFLPPHEAFLMTLAGQLYDRMDSLFEEAPINEIPSTETWVMDLGLLDTVTTPLPEVTPDSRLTKDVERCLAYSHGHPLLYFATYGALHAFLTGTLEWEDHPGGVLADLKDEKDFVIYANAKGMLLAPGVASCLRCPNGRRRGLRTVLPARPLSLRPAEVWHAARPPARCRPALCRRSGSAATALGLHRPLLSGRILRRGLIKSGLIIANCSD
mgnify:CR=1 FL=1